MRYISGLLDAPIPLSYYHLVKIYMNVPLPSKYWKYFADRLLLLVDLLQSIVS